LGLAEALGLAVDFDIVVEWLDFIAAGEALGAGEVAAIAALLDSRTADAMMADMVERIGRGYSLIRYGWIAVCALE
jgi:hypothetical protein